MTNRTEVYDASGKIIGYLTPVKDALMQGPATACVVPTTKEGQTKVDALGARQQYCLCLIASAEHVLLHLQNELQKESPEAAKMVRGMVRELKSTITDKYSLDSRHLLSIELAKLRNNG